MAKADNARRFSGVGGSHHNPLHIAARRAEAKERQDTWSKLSPKDQLAALDRRLGKGLGATRQRVRLALLVDTKSSPPVTHSEVTPKERLSAKERHKRGL